MSNNDTTPKPQTSLPEAETLSPATTTSENSAGELQEAHDLLVKERDLLGNQLWDACVKVLKEFEARTQFRPEFISLRVDNWFDEFDTVDPDYTISMVGRC